MKLFLTILVFLLCSNGANADVYSKIKIEYFPKYVEMTKRTNNLKLSDLKFEEDFFSYSILQQVNDFVNNSIVYKPEVGSNDYWQSANETLALGTGDCEDFAILKKQILLNNGFHEDQLMIIVGYYKENGKTFYHAILRVKQGTKFFYLDNRSRWVTEKLPLNVDIIYGINNFGAWGKNNDEKFM